MFRYSDFTLRTDVTAGKFLAFCYMSSLSWLWIIVSSDECPKSSPSTGSITPIIIVTLMDLALETGLFRPKEILIFLIFKEWLSYYLGMKPVCDRIISIRFFVPVNALFFNLKKFLKNIFEISKSFGGARFQVLVCE